MDGVVEDLKVTKIKQQTEKTKDREQWRLIVEEPKADLGLWRREEGRKKGRKEGQGWKVIIEIKFTPLSKVGVAFFATVFMKFVITEYLVVIS